MSLPVASTDDGLVAADDSAELPPISVPSIAQVIRALLEKGRITAQEAQAMVPQYLLRQPSEVRRSLDAGVAAGTWTLEVFQVNAIPFPMQPPHDDAALRRLAAIFWAVHEPGIRAALAARGGAGCDAIVAEMKEGYLRGLQATYRQKRLCASFAHTVLRRV